MRTLLLVLSLCFAFSASGAKPTSVKYIEDIVTESEQIYSYYIVKCTDGKQADISAWDNRKLWCIGKGNKEDAACAKKQIKTAKQVCKA